MMRLFILTLGMLLLAATLFFIEKGESRKYQVSLISGYAYESSGSGKTAEPLEYTPIISGSISLDVPFTIKSKNGYTYVTGTLLRQVDGSLHFKGEAQVISTDALFDDTLQTGRKVFMPRSFGFSGRIDPFFVRFDRELEGRTPSRP